MIPEENEKVPTKYGDVDAYLIEARSIGGLSGSPVFLRDTSTGKIYLFGLAHGHWDIPPANKNDIQIDYDSKSSVNMGIAIVIPATKILEVLYHEEFIKIRNQYDKEMKDKTPLDYDVLNKTNK